MMAENQPDPELIAKIEAVRHLPGNRGLNNFHGILPGSFLRVTVFKGELLGKRTEGRYKEKTFEEYLNDVDEEVRKSEIDVDKLRALQNEYRSGYPRERAVVLEEIRDLTFPVYRSLRIAGYSHEDLTA